MLNSLSITQTETIPPSTLTAISTLTAAQETEMISLVQTITHLDLSRITEISTATEVVISKEIKTLYLTETSVLPNPPSTVFITPQASTVTAEAIT